MPYLNHAAGTKKGWGGPAPSHSAYESIFTDSTGGEDAPNCLEVPAGEFDLVTRYYLSEEEIIRGEWKFPLPILE